MMTAGARQRRQRLTVSLSIRTSYAGFGQESRTPAGAWAWGGGRPSSSPRIGREATCPIHLGRSSPQHLEPILPHLSEQPTVKGRRDAVFCARAPALTATSMTSGQQDPISIATPPVQRDGATNYDISGPLPSCRESVCPPSLKRRARTARSAAGHHSGGGAKRAPSPADIRFGDRQRFEHLNRARSCTWIGEAIAANMP